MKLPKGMTVKPYGWGFEPMCGAFFGCVQFCISKPECRERFKNETGHDLDLLIPNSPIETMIDKACEIDEKVMARFCDFVATNFWGVSGSSKK